MVVVPALDLEKQNDDLVDLRPSFSDPLIEDRLFGDLDLERRRLGALFFKLCLLVPASDFALLDGIGNIGADAGV